MLLIQQSSMTADQMVVKQELMLCFKTGCVMMIVSRKLIEGCQRNKQSSSACCSAIFTTILVAIAIVK